jgi:cytochrome c oxidase subunit I+III
LTIVARRTNRRDEAGAFYAALVAGVALALGGVYGLVDALRQSGLDPTADVYGSIVWLLVIWSALHVLIGVVMQLYCVARRLAGRMTARHDIDIHNVALYWHFTAVTVVITVAIVAAFPMAV